MLNACPSPIVEKFFFRSKIPEICRKSPFLQIFLGLFPYISCFFSHKNIYDIAFFFVRSFVRLFVLSLLSGRSNQHVACFDCAKNQFHNPLWR